MSGGRQSSQDAARLTVFSGVTTEQTARSSAMPSVGERGSKGQRRRPMACSRRHHMLLPTPAPPRSPLPGTQEPQPRSFAGLSCLALVSFCLIPVKCEDH